MRPIFVKWQPTVNQTQGCYSSPDPAANLARITEDNTQNKAVEQTENSPFHGLYVSDRETGKVRWAFPNWQAQQKSAFRQWQPTAEQPEVTPLIQSPSEAQPTLNVETRAEIMACKKTRSKGLKRTFNFKPYDHPTPPPIASAAPSEHVNRSEPERYTGVYKSGKNWRAVVARKYLGTFTCAKAAALVYDKFVIDGTPNFNQQRRQEVIKDLKNRGISFEPINRKTSTYRGVAAIHGQKWEARATIKISLAGSETKSLKSVKIGRFRTEIAAAIARDEFVIANRSVKQVPNFSNHVRNELKKTHNDQRLFKK